MGIPKGKMIVKSKTNPLPVDPNDGLTKEELKAIREFEQSNRTENFSNHNPIENVSSTIVQGNGIPDMELSPTSFGEEFDHLPIIEVASVTPSGGFSYPKGYEIKYRPYVFGEINKISNDKLSFVEMAKIVLSGITTNFPIKDLTFYDFTFVALLRKLSSLRDSKVKVTHQCVKCKRLNTYVINVSSDEDTDLNFWEMKYKNLPIVAKLEFGGELMEYSFMPLTINQHFFLCQSGLEKDMSAILAAQCTNEKFEVMYKKINMAFGEDEIVLKEVDDMLTHGLKPIASECSECKAITMLRIDSNKVILRPFRRPENTVKDRIRFG